MIKLLHFIQENHNLVTILLFLPVLGLLFSTRFELQGVPESPHPRFEVEFSVPSRDAEEILSRVTEKAERIFNGLPKFVSMTSQTSDESVVIDLVFSDEVTSRTAYLLVQEKLDRIKLELPRDVESIDVRPIHLERPPDLEARFKEKVPVSELRERLKNSLSAIQRSEPNIRAETEIVVRPQARQLFGQSLSVSNMVQALKIGGFNTTISRQAGVMYGLGGNFQSYQDVGGAIVGKREEKQSGMGEVRPVRLSEVSMIEAQTPHPTDRVQLWIDLERLSVSDVKDELRKIGGVSFSRPYLRLVLFQSLHPIMVMIVLFLAQMAAFRLIFGERMRFLSLLRFNGIIIIHFLFWKGVVAGSFNVLDMNALVLTLILGTVFWISIFSRIRNDFLPDHTVKRVPRTVEQSSFFTLQELLPTIFVLVLGLFILNLPILRTGLNFPSRYILESFFYFGAPILFFVLVAMPLIVTPSWVSRALSLPPVQADWRIDPRWLKAGVIAIIMSTLLLPVLTGFTPIGIESAAEDNYFMSRLRGYGESLRYLKPPIVEAGSEMQVWKKNQTDSVVRRNFTSSGIRFLGDLNLLGFSNALKEIQSHSIWGYLEGGDRIPMRFGGLSLSSFDIKNLYLAGMDSEVEGKTLGVLTDERVESRRTEILRNKLRTVDFLEFGLGYRGNLKEKTKNSEPTQWTSHILDQIKDYHYLQIVAVVFLFLILSVYVNSFVRGLILTLFALVPVTILFLWKVIVPGTYNADSLWMMMVFSSFGLVILLIVSRAIDIDRSRGVDREVAVEEARLRLAPSVFYLTLLPGICFILGGILEWIPGIPHLGLWREGVLGGGLLIGTSWLTYRYLFPILYLSSEEVLDEVTVQIYQILFTRKLLGGRK